MNSPRFYHENASEHNIRYQTTGYETKDLGCATRKRRQRDYSNPAYRLYWVEHLIAMEDLKPSGAKIMARIICDQRNKGYCYRSQQFIARKTGSSVRTVAAMLAEWREDKSIRMVTRYRKCGRGRTVSYIFINWDHPRWKDCPERPLRATQAESSTEQTSFDDVLNANCADVSLRDIRHEPEASRSHDGSRADASEDETAAAEPQAEKAEQPPSTNLSQSESEVVFQTLTELGVPEDVAADDARKAPREAIQALAVALMILSRGGIDNPPGLACAALRNPKRFTTPADLRHRDYPRFLRSLLPRPAPPPPKLCPVCNQRLDGPHPWCDEGTDFETWFTKRQERIDNMKTEPRRAPPRRDGPLCRKCQEPLADESSIEGCHFACHYGRQRRKSAGG